MKTATALLSTQATAVASLLCAVLPSAALAQAQAQAQAQAPAMAAPATAADTVCASVEVHNVRPQQGQLMVTAYANADSFGKKPMISVRVPAGDATTTLQLCGLSRPVVALMLFQDLDSDGRLGRNVLGMPTEPWGGSGSPGAFGPSWDNSKVTLDGKPLVVRMSQ